MSAWQGVAPGSISRGCACYVTPTRPGTGTGRTPRLRVSVLRRVCVRVWMDGARSTWSRPLSTADEASASRAAAIASRQPAQHSPTPTTAGVARWLLHGGWCVAAVAWRQLHGGWCMAAVAWRLLRHEASVAVQIMAR
jgi:hypothetical protein